MQKYAGETTSAIYPEGSPNPDGPTEPELFLQTMQSGDYSQLDAGLADYRQIYERLQNLTVPKNLIAFHKEELNIFSSLIKVYQGVRTFNDDPLKSFLAIQTYQATMQQMIGWMTRLDQFMAANYGKWFLKIQQKNIIRWLQNSSEVRLRDAFEVGLRAPRWVL